MTFINFGCGLSVGAGWQNFDASPTLRLQRWPLVGMAARAWLAPQFPSEAQYGDVVMGLPVNGGSVELVYCSHVLEHLALDDLRLALAEVARIMKPGGIFRGVLPDLQNEVRVYLADPSEDACSRFMARTSLGLPVRRRGLLAHLRSLYGNSQHHWMWDYKGLQAELQVAGFVAVRRAQYGDSKHAPFAVVEDEARWRDALGFECLRAV